MTKETMTAKEYGSLLFRERTGRGYTQTLVAKIAGVQGSYVSSVEAGKYVPKEAFDKIVNATNTLIGRDIQVTPAARPSIVTIPKATTTNNTATQETQKMSRREFQSYLRKERSKRKLSMDEFSLFSGVGRATGHRFQKYCDIGKDSLNKLVAHANKTFGANIEIDYADDFTTTTKPRKTNTRKTRTSTPTTTKTTTTGVSIPVTMSVNVSLNESQIEAAYNKLPETSRKTLLKRFVGNI